MTRIQRHLAAIAIPLLLALAGALRLAWRDYVSADMHSALLGWYDYLALSPGIEALRARISTYSPPYLYILALSVHLREAFWPELSRVMAVKLPSLLMDIGAALAFQQPHRAMSLSSGARVNASTNSIHGDTFELLGVSRIEDNWSRGRSYTLRLLTRALKPAGNNYTLRLDLYDQQGRSLQIAVDAAPELPASQWIDGRVFAQNVLVPVWPLTPAPSLTLLKVSWIDPDTGAALVARCAGQPCDGRLPGPPFELNKDDVRPFESASLAQFAGELALARADVPAAPLGAGETLTVSLVWQRLTQQPGPMTEFVHIVAADGTLVAQSDGPLNDGRFQPQQLRNRQFMPSAKAVTLPAAFQPGLYRVRVGLYRPDSLARLPAQANGAALPDDLVDIGAVAVQ